MRWHQRVLGTHYHVSELKSAFQKLFRRRDDRAYDVAAAMIGSSPQEAMVFLRRWPSILVEEGVQGLIVEAMTLLDHHELHVGPILHTVARGMAAGRDKDPSAGMGAVSRKANAKMALTPTEQVLLEMHDAWDDQMVSRVLRDVGRTAKDAKVVAMARALEIRAKMRVRSGDAKIFASTAAVMLARERLGTYEMLPVPVRVRTPEPKPITTLPWWTMDPHTQIGKRALRAVLKQAPMEPQRAFKTWFMLSSDQIEGYVRREGWYDDRRELQVTAQDRKWWRAAEKLAKKWIEAEVERREQGPIAKPRGPMSVKVMGSGRYAVSSEKTAGVWYTVTRDPGPRWRCTCMHFQKTGAICKHIQRVQQDRFTQGDLFDA